MLMSNEIFGASRPRTLTRRCTRSMLALCLAAAPGASPWAAKVGDRFPTVEDFVRSVPGASAEIAVGYGDLLGTGGHDWAGAVSIHHPDALDDRQIIVLVQQADGSYQVAAQGPVESTEGGTGNHGLDGVSISQGSVYVSWSWNWHGCSGRATQQIRLYKGMWRVIGAEFEQSAATQTPDGAYDDGDSATLSHNLLTGSVVIDFKPLHGKAVTKRLRLKPETVLLDENFGEGAGAVQEFSKYAGC
jgi:hypothetical protein